MGFDVSRDGRAAWAWSGLAGEFFFSSFHFLGSPCALCRGCPYVRKRNNARSFPLGLPVRVSSRYLEMCFVSSSFVWAPQAFFSASFFFRVCSIPCRLEEKDGSFYRQFQLIISGLDSIEARRWLNAMVHSLVRQTQQNSPSSSSCPPSLLFFFIPKPLLSSSSFPPRACWSCTSSAVLLSFFPSSSSLACRRLPSSRVRVLFSPRFSFPHPLCGWHSRHPFHWTFFLFFSSLSSCDTRVLTC